VKHREEGLVSVALSLADIATLSSLLDQALELPAEQRQAWLDALAPEHRCHTAVLRKMLDRASSGAADPLLQALPKLQQDESVARAGDGVGAYRLVREIGKGGMGSVWLAERADGAFTRQVAIKLPRLAWGAGLAARMAREREIGMLLEHPNIARLYDAGVDVRGRPFLALEYVDGEPIDAWCHSRTLGVRERLQLFLQVARALAYAHGRRVVHRDLKPSNVLVTPDGQARLLDFGVAKLLTEAAPAADRLTRAQERVMTLQYASPEQVAGDDIGVPSDIYSLGVLLFELLTGTLPIQPRRPSPAAIEDAILQGVAPLASSRAADPATKRALRGDVDAILAKAMQREPARRYASAEAFAADVERHLQGRTIAARPDSAAYRLSRTLRRHGLGLSAAAALLAVLVGGGAAVMLQAQRAAHHAERARLATAFAADMFRTSAHAPTPRDALSGNPLLDRGARLIVAHFPDQPDMQAELFGVVGRIYADLGATHSAAGYVQRQLQLLDELPTDPPRRARALLLAADIALQERRDNDAQVHAAQAVQMLKPADTAWPEALVMQARVQQARGNVAAAKALLVEIEAALRARGSGPSTALAWAQWLEGGVDAEKLIQARSRGLQTALDAEGPLSPTAITMRVTLAYNLITNNHTAEGRRQYAEAVAALRSLGGASEIQAAVTDAGYWAAAAMMAAAPPGEAAAAIQKDRDLIAATTLPLPPDVLDGVSLQLARAYAIYGDVGRGDQALNDQVVQRLQETQSLRRRFDLLAISGELALLAGRHEAAAHILSERREVRVRQGLQAAPFAAFDWAFLALNLTMQEQYAAAADLLAQAPQFHALKADPVAGDGYARLLPNEAARMHLARGDVRAAAQVLPALPPGMKGDNVGIFSEFALHGEVRCAQGRHEDGLALLLRAIRLREGGVSASDPTLARWRSVAGACEWARGQRQAARAYAAQARAAFTAQPGVSPYFKVPLARLEQLLASPARH
jgi:serine/threonine-protein kinase